MCVFCAMLVPSIVCHIHTALPTDTHCFHTALTCSVQCWFLVSCVTYIQPCPPTHIASNSPPWAFVYKHKPLFRPATSFKHGYSIGSSNYSMSSPGDACCCKANFNIVSLLYLEMESSLFLPLSLPSRGGFPYILMQRNYIMVKVWLHRG